MNVPVPPPEGLEDRGQALWDALTFGRDLRPAAAVLAAEAARLADRLERLDRILRAEDAEWARIREGRFDGDDTVLVIDSALSEARQQASTLRQLLATIEDLAPKESDEPSDALSRLLAGLSAPLRDPA